MNYQPVKIHELFEVMTNLKTGKVERRPKYFQVRSKSLGTCGHRHTTKKAAEPCFTKMEAEFKARKSEAAKNAWAARRAA